MLDTEEVIEDVHETESTSESSKRKHQPHDKFVKRLLSKPGITKDILKMYLPENILTMIDLNHLELQRDSFIDDEHRVFAVDLLYKTKFQGEEGYLWILIEHQRESDYWMPVRVFKYMAIIWDHIRTSNKSKGIKTKKLPLVYPIIIYNGDRPYSDSLILSDLIEPESSRELFNDYFKMPFHLVDLSIIKDETLRQQHKNFITGVALSVTLKHIDDKDFVILFEDELLDIYKYLDQAGYREDFYDMIYYLLNEGKFSDIERFLIIIQREFSKEVGDKVMSIAQQLEARGEERGIEKGKIEGKMEVAEHLLAIKLKPEFVAEVTGLPLAKIEELRKKSH